MPDAPDPTVALRNHFDQIAREIEGLHINTDTLLVVFLAIRRLLVEQGLATESDIREAVIAARAEYEEVIATEDMLEHLPPVSRRSH